MQSPPVLLPERQSEMLPNNTTLSETSLLKDYVMVNI